MGQRQNQDEIVYGNDCLRGWDAGETPKYIYVRFSKIIKCPDLNGVQYEIPPNDRVFKLTQSETWPCLWEITTTGWHVVLDLQFDPPNAIFWLEHVPDGRVYFYNVSGTPVNEGAVYDNEIIDCLLGHPAHHGIATATWRLESLSLMGSLNITTQDDLFMEMRPREDGKKVYKYCKLEDATNIAILYEP